MVLSCIDNLKVFADIFGVPTDKIKSTLQQVGLKDAGGKSALTLSKGMRASLSLVRVFMHSPKLIFLDEPTSGLDPQTINKIFFSFIGLGYITANLVFAP